MIDPGGLARPLAAAVRLAGASAAIRDAFPAAYAPIYGAVTALGGATLLMLLLSVAYWTGPRRRTLTVVSFAYLALAVTLTLKAVVGLPRPPEELYLLGLEADPWGFPSGHTVAAVVVYGGAVATFDRLQRPAGYAAAAVLAVAVALSRVVLGVHYLGDVLAGAVVGLVLLSAGHRFVAGEPRRGFAAAVALSVVAVAAVWWRDPAAVGEAFTALGGAVGGLLGATQLDRLPARETAVEAVALVVAGVVVIGALQAVEGVVVAAAGSVLLSGVAIAAVNAALVAGIVTVPLVVGRFDYPGLDAVGR